MTGLNPTSIHRLCTVCTLFILTVIAWWMTPLAIPSSLASSVHSAKPQVSVQDRPDILGGREAEPDAWPWQAALIAKEYENAYEGQFCGGSLIAPEWVLTAAHCVDGRYLSKSNIEVVLGRHRLSSDEGEQIAIEEIILHPSYDIELISGDIALIHLAEPSTQPPVALYKSRGLITDTVEDHFINAMAIGWGQKDRGYWGASSDVLREVMVPIADHAQCQIKWEEYVRYSYYIDNPIIVTDEMICTGYEKGGKDSCYGDSGGPLMVWDASESAWQQTGVVSFGPSGCEQSGVHDVYTRISSYADWIEGCMSDLNSQACVGGDQYEPNNRPDKATVIASDAISQTHSFHSANDIDWFQFEAIEGGIYNIETHHVGGKSDPLLWLYDIDGATALTYDDDSGFDRAASITWEAPNSGTYYVYVEDYFNRAGNQSNYGLSIRKIATQLYMPIIAKQPGPDAYYEPNGTREEAIFIHTNGVPQVHSFEGYYDVDWLRFNASAGNRYVIETSDLCSRCDTVLYLYVEDSESYIDYDSDSGEGEASRLEIAVENDNTYYISIGNYGWSEEGDNTYNVSVAATPMSPTSGTYADLRERIYR